MSDSGCDRFGGFVAPGGERALFTPPDVAIVCCNFDEDMVTCGTGVSDETCTDSEDIFHPDGGGVNVYMCYFTHVWLLAFSAQLSAFGSCPSKCIVAQTV